MRRLALAFAFALAACGPSQPPASEAPPAPVAETAAPPATAEESEEAAEMQARVAALPAPYDAASYEAGRRVFAQCRSCHTIEAGGPNRVGPNLHGIVGRQAGSKEGFSYSPALQTAGFAWDAARLDAYITNPREFLPGNRMAFVGVRNETQRRDLIAYLSVMSEDD
jgi:cytochrome c